MHSLELSKIFTFKKTEEGEKVGRERAGLVLWWFDGAFLGRL